MKAYRPTNILKAKPILVSNMTGKIVCLGGKTDKYPEASQADYKLYFEIFKNRKKVKEYIEYVEITKPDPGRGADEQPDLSGVI